MIWPFSYQGFQTQCNDFARFTLFSPALRACTAAQRTGDAAGAVAAYREAVAADPSHADALNNLGKALSDLGQGAPPHVAPSPDV